MTESLYDLDREVPPIPGFRFCVNETCGVEVLHGHPTRACRKHRPDGKLRGKVRPLKVVTDGAPCVSTMGLFALQELYRAPGQ